MVNSSHNFEKSNERSFDDLEMQHVEKQKCEDVYRGLRPSKPEQVEKYCHQNQGDFGDQFFASFLRISVE